MDIVQRVTEELAEGQRVEQRRLILSRRGSRGSLASIGLGIEAIGEINLIGGRAVVTGAASGDGQPKSEGLEFPRIVAWQLESFDMHRPDVTALADPLRRRARSLGQQIAEPFPGSDLPQRAQHSRAVAPARDLVRGHSQIDTSLATLHRPGDRATSRDSVHSQLVAERGGAQHSVRVAHPAEGTKGEKGLVLQPHRGLRAAIQRAVVMLAANGAGGAGMLTGVVLQAQRLAGKRLRPVEVTASEIARRQQAQAIEEGDIGYGADLTILGRRRTDAAGSQIAGQY